ncbi:VgrG-related protein [Actinoplanes sp. NPDC089786]|uniref:VgrG-related protein n=1 Tax=Actinoplanes sp. NPDC089786 TaxID=3155185 RepID=UPI00343C96E3
MANESFSNTPVVTVNGNALPADLAAMLSLAYVDDSRNLPDVFVLRFRDPGSIVLKKAGFAIGVKVKVSVQTAEPGGPKDLIEGEVTALELDLDPTGTITEVRGQDVAHRLFRGRRVAAYPGMSLGDVVRKVAQRAKVDIGKVDNVPGVGAGKDGQLSQNNVSDWEFLSQLADLVGAHLAVEEGKLCFQLPEPPAKAPTTDAKATTSPLVLEAHRNLVSLRATVRASNQVPTVEAYGWDMEHKQAVTATATPRTPGMEVPGAKPTEIAAKVGAPPLRAADPAWQTTETVKAVATSLADQLGGSAVELDGVAKGNPSLRAGAAVALTNVGEPFTGKYVLTQTRHTFSPTDGYRTMFTVAGRAERSLYDLSGGGAGGGLPAEVMSGLVPGLVSDIKDPRKLGRVKVTFPWLDKEYVTGWARVVQPGAGASRGALVLPEVKDEVLVGFAHGDPDNAYVLGGMHNGTDKPPKLETEPVDGGSGAVAVRGFVSRKGHSIQFIEDGGVLIATGDGKLSVRLDVKSGTVEAKGDQIKLTATKTVEIKGPNGVKIDAGSGALDMKGMTASLAGQSKTDVKASGPVTVSGTPIKLN